MGIQIFLIAVLTLPLRAAESPKKPEMWESTRQYMVEISRQLGVTCAYCHDVKNYSDKSKPTFKIAKDHMEIVEVLNKKYSDKLPKVDCYICHRGVAKPDYKEKVSAF